MFGMPKGLEIVIILLVVLLIFGPKNLPKLGKMFGKTVKNVRDGMEGVDEEPASAAPAASPAATPVEVTVDTPIAAPVEAPVASEAVTPGVDQRVQ